MESETQRRKRSVKSEANESKKGKGNKYRRAKAGLRKKDTPAQPEQRRRVERFVPEKNTCPCLGILRRKVQRQTLLYRSLYLSLPLCRLSLVMLHREAAQRTNGPKSFTSPKDPSQSLKRGQEKTNSYSHTKQT